MENSKNKSRANQEKAGSGENDQTTVNSPIHGQSSKKNKGAESSVGNQGKNDCDNPCDCK